MNVEEIRAFCLEFQGVEESFPFGDQTLVFKVGGKIFLLLALDANPVQFNIKCDPDEAIKLREKHACVIPGYHMNKRHWNTILCEYNLSKKLAFEWIKSSYLLVFDSLPKSLKSSIRTAN
ncbi:MAG: MmcQ/YjbR family DNA-binding protein [Bacteroidota bacterium]